MKLFDFSRVFDFMLSIGRRAVSISNVGISGGTVVLILKTVQEGGGSNLSGP